jgi:hypothetical protein
MGFKITWSSDSILSDLRACAREAGSPYNDGFTAWHCKQDLLRVKYELDQMLDQLPNFANEQEYIQELKKKTVWKILKQP